MLRRQLLVLDISVRIPEKCSLPELKSSEYTASTLQ